MKLFSLLITPAGADGDDDQEEVTAVLQRAHHARRRAEGVARHLLARVDRNCGGHMSSGVCQPWEDVSTNSRTARYRRIVFLADLYIIMLASSSKYKQVRVVGKTANLTAAAYFRYVQGNTKSIKYEEVKTSPYI